MAGKISMEMEYVVYILRSKKDNKRYIGMTNDFKRRLEEHQKGEVRSTFIRRPFDVLYTESYKSKKEAEVRERYFKSGAGREWLDRRNIK